MSVPLGLGMTLALWLAAGMCWRQLGSAFVYSIPQLLGYYKKKLLSLPVTWLLKPSCLPSPSLALLRTLPVLCSFPVLPLLRPTWGCREERH